jgi:hypothetical protein
MAVRVQTNLKEKSDERDVQRMAELRAESGSDIAKHLFNAAVACGANRARNRAVLIGRCADADNVWTANHLENEAGDFYEGVGVLTSCGSRLCPSCMAAMRRRSRKRAREIIGAIEYEATKRLRFITLTCPTLQGVSLVDTIAIFNRAFALLSERPFWNARVDAGIKAVEFTVNRQGYNTHIHLAVYGSFIDRDAQKEEETRIRRAKRAERMSKKPLRLVKDDLPPLGNLQDEWTDCLVKAARLNNSKELRATREIEWDVPYHATLNYDSTLKAHVLGSYCLLETRGEIRPLVVAKRDGCYSRFPVVDGEIVEVQPTPASKAAVDIRAVREKGQPPNSNEVSLEHVLSEVSKYMTKAESWLKIPAQDLVEIAEVKRWARCFEILGKWRGEIKSVDDLPKPIIRIRESETWEEFCARVAREGGDPRSYGLAWKELNDAGRLYAASSGDASLDTPLLSPANISPANSTPDSPDPPQESWVRDRQPSLMKLGETMDFAEWLKIVSVRLVTARRARRSLLSRQFPLARFRALDGSEWEGQAHIEDRRSVRIDALCATFKGRAGNVIAFAN